MYCLWAVLPDRLRCTRCGQEIERTSGGIPRVECLAGLGDMVASSLLQKATNFAVSTARHVAAGMPQCSQEQIEARFAICQQCEHFDGKACRLCGCPVVREKKFVSKLSWANEKCPAGKWGPVTG